MKREKDVVFYKSLLFKGGIIVLAALILSIVIGALDTYYLVMRQEQEAALKKAEDACYMIQVPFSDETVDWLLDYCEKNYEKMRVLSIEEAHDRDELEAYGQTHEKAIDTITWDSDMITPEYLEKMSEEDQLLFAEVWYNGRLSGVNVAFDSLGKADLDYAVFKYIGNDQAFVYFGNVFSDPDGTEIGDVIPFSLEKHPIASQVIKTGMIPHKVEHIRSTTDGKEYLYACWPLVLNGKVKAVAALQYPWSDTQKNLIDRILHVGGRVLAYLIFAFVILVIIFYLMVFRPIRKLQLQIRDYSEKKDSEVVGNELLEINGRDDEVGSLSRDVTDLTKEVDRYVGEVCTLAEEKAAIGAALSVATQIQADALPQNFSDYSERKEFAFHAMMKPSLEVGGDFYDFFMIDNDHLALVIADVSDKGVPSALFMMKVQTMIRVLYKVDNRINHPSQLFDIINNSLDKNNTMGMFVTVWMGILEISTGKMACSNAGHEYPAILRADSDTDENGFSLYKVPHSPPIAVFSGAPFINEDIELHKGDVLFVYTDGVTEAADENAELFGEERMVTALNELRGESPEGIVNGMLDRIERFSGEGNQFDDITMLCLKYNGPS